MSKEKEENPRASITMITNNELINKALKEMDLADERCEADIRSACERLLAELREKIRKEHEEIRLTYVKACNKNLNGKAAELERELDKRDYALSLLSETKEVEQKE